MDLLDKLSKDGFIGPFAIEDFQLIDAMKMELDRVESNFKNLHLTSCNCQQLLSKSALVQNVESVFGKGLKLWRTNCFKKTDGSGEVKWHHDRHFENADDAIDFSNLNNHFSILLAITDIDDESGVMEFIPGSHLPISGYERDTRPFHKRQLQDHFLDIPQEVLEQKIQIPLKKGEFILFHSALLHRSLAAKGQNIQRYSMVARLCLPSTVIPEALASKSEVFNYPFTSKTDGKLLGKVAIVTGGSKGIGKAIANHLLAHGCKVAILGRDGSAITLAQQELGNVTTPENVLSLIADVTDFVAVEEAFRKIQSQFGSIDIVFANAAINEAKGRVEDISPESWFQPLESNIKCTFNTCKVAIEFMKSNGGNIITLGSGIGHAGGESISSYASAKAVNWIFSKSLAMEVSKYNINVNELVPGPVKTAMNPNAQGTHWKEPDDIGPLAVMLASQDLRNGATGQSFSLKRF